MKRILFGFSVVILILLCFVASEILAAEVKTPVPTISVLSNNLYAIKTQYYIYPETAEMIASDIVNYLNKSKVVKAAMISDSKDKIQKTKFVNDSLNCIDEYRFNYTIDWKTFRKMSAVLKTDTILLVTSDLDIESQFLKGTVWNFLNFPGEDVVHPTYIITTQMTLVDPVSEVILWQNNFKKNVRAKNFDLVYPRFSPVDNQLSKLKNYSEKLASEVGPVVEHQIVYRNTDPDLIPELPKKTKTIQLEIPDFKLPLKKRSVEHLQTPKQQEFSPNYFYEDL